MKRLLFLTAAVCFAQTAEWPEPVMRVDVNLVQLDAVVTDRKGNPVRDLHPEDFEVYQDGKLQKITRFSYVTVAPPHPASLAKRDPHLPPAPGRRLRQEETRRTIVLVADDLGLSFESTYSVRRALRKFVDEQMQPGDLVAILRTSAGMGALQQFTADRQQLYAAIERIRFSLNGRASLGAFRPLADPPDVRLRANSRNTQPALPNLAEDRGAAYDISRETTFAVGTLGAVQFVCRGLREVPGRKALVLFSDGFPLFPHGEDNGRIVEAVHQLTDSANRAGVILYTVDARGLPVLGPTAEDHPSVRGGPTDITDRLAERRSDYYESQEGLSDLARETGGRFLHDGNDLNYDVGRVLDDLSGYYLIGYQPEDTTFRSAAGKFHRLRVRMVPGGLTVRSRTGFLGVTDDQSKPVYKTRVEQLGAAITSPFTTGAIPLRLTCLFAEVPRRGAVVRAMLHIDAKKLTFEEKLGTHFASLDLVVMTFGETGKLLDSVDRTFTMKMEDREYREALAQGLLYSLDIAAGKPGGYQVRAAVRDAGSGEVGSSSQFIEVPDLRRNRMVISGIVLNGKNVERDERYGLANTGTPAVRVFHPGDMVQYGFLIFNAPHARATGKPDLAMKVRVFRDDAEIYQSEASAIDAADVGDARLAAGGALKLGPGMRKGDYILQAVVTDKTGKSRSPVAYQSIDFEVR